MLIVKICLVITIASFLINRFCVWYIKSWMSELNPIMRDLILVYPEKYPKTIIRFAIAGNLSRFLFWLAGGIGIVAVGFSWM